MLVHVNGEERKVQARFLDALLDELGFDSHWLATAVNHELVAAGDRQGHKLHEHDRIEILSPMQGG